MSIDYGDAHTGVAFSDPMGVLVGSTTTIHSWRTEVVVRELARLVSENQVTELVMGFPKNMDGTDGLRADLYRDLAAQVEEATGLPVTFWDERRTTIDAHRILFEAGQDGRKRKKTVDSVAAALILEGYLTFRRHRQA
jgi:putative Holliday junction resolvase